MLHADDRPPRPQPLDEPPSGSGPREQFWPYANLEEEPSDEELARLDPDLQDALYDRPISRPFSYTIVFAPFDGPGLRRGRRAREGDERVPRDRARATGCAIARGSGPTRCSRCGTCGRSSGSLPSADVLLDDRPVPYARELWLPLLWYLIPR